MRKLKVKIDFGNTVCPVGSLYLSEKIGRHVFSYDQEMIQTGLEISPKILPLGTDTYSAEINRDLYDLHGVFADSLPDEWGKKVQDAEFEKIGLQNISAIDRLAFVGRNGIGALMYEPAQEFEKGKEIVTLAELRKSAQRVLSGHVDEVSDELLHCGGSAGGARPKFMVDLDLSNLDHIRYSRGIWDRNMCPVILKVPMKDQDHWQRIEYVYSQLARKAGLNIPSVYLLSGSNKSLAYFAIERFDILKEGVRLHAHTFAGLLGINFRETLPDYSVLLRTTADLTKDHRQVSEAYRRMVFNYLGHNKDDHAKNFTFLMNKKGDWTLSPAYDLGYSSGENGLHLMSINGKRRNAGLKDFEAMAENFDIKEWKEIVKNTCEALKQWKSKAIECGVSQKLMNGIHERIKENTKRIGRV